MINSYVLGVLRCNPSIFSNLVHTYVRYFKRMERFSNSGQFQKRTSKFGNPLCRIGSASFLVDPILISSFVNSYWSIQHPCFCTHYTQMTHFNIFFLLLSLSTLALAYDWVQTIQNATTTNTRYSKIIIPMKNYNYNPGTYYKEDIFVSPYFLLTSEDFTYDLCSSTAAKVAKDMPSIFNNTNNGNPCATYFCSQTVPFYLAKGKNSTTNTTHLAVQTYCTQCEATRPEGFSIDVATNGTCNWYDTSKCGRQNQTDRLCMMYYPVTALTTKTVSYYWDYQSYMINMDPGLWFLLGYFHYTSRVLYITQSFIGILALVFLYLIPETILKIIYKRDTWRDRALDIFNIKNGIFALLVIGSLVMVAGSIVSWAEDNTVGLTTTGAVTYTQLGLTLFAFTLIIIQWKHIAEATSLVPQPFSLVNRLLILLSFVTFFIWGGLLVGSYIASSLSAPNAAFVYAACLFGVSILFGILGLIVLIAGIILTKKYLGGNLCNLKNIETFQMYRLKFTQIMILTSVTLFVFVYIAFYNGLTLWTSRDIISIRFYYLYRSQLAFVTQFLSWCLIFSIVDLTHVKKGYSCGKCGGEDSTN
jgi:hypothetical protein